MSSVYSPHRYERRAAVSEMLSQAILCILFLTAVTSRSSNAQSYTQAAQNERQQSEFSRRKLTQYVHKAWTFNSGLPGTRIQAITQTADGFLWLGTDGGLARFDGLNFSYFDPTTTPVFTTANIHSLAAGSDGSLWVGTEDGLIRAKNGTFTRYTEQDGLGGNNIGALQVNGNGTLLVQALRNSPGLGRFSRWSNGKFVGQELACCLPATLERFLNVKYGIVFNPS